LPYHQYVSIALPDFVEMCMLVHHAEADLGKRGRKNRGLGDANPQCAPGRNPDRNVWGQSPQELKFLNINVFWASPALLLENGRLYRVQKGVYESTGSRQKGAPLKSPMLWVPAE